MGYPIQSIIEWTPPLWCSLYVHFWSETRTNFGSSNWTLKGIFYWKKQLKFGVIKTACSNGVIYGVTIVTCVIECLSTLLVKERTLTIKKEKIQTLTLNIIYYGGRVSVRELSSISNRGINGRRIGTWRKSMDSNPLLQRAPLGRCLGKWWWLIYARISPCILFIDKNDVFI